MTTPMPQTEAGDSAALDRIKDIPELRQRKRFGEVRQILAAALRHPDVTRPDVLRALIIGIAGLPVLLRYCASLINDYRTKCPDLFHKDLPVLEAMCFCAWALEQWNAAAAAHALVIAGRTSFALEDHAGLARQGLGRGQRLCLPVGLPDTVARAFGEMALQFDLFHRGRTLGLVEAEDRAVIINDALVCNRALLGYWKEKVVVYDTASLPRRTRLTVCQAAHDPLSCLMIPGIGCVAREAAYAFLNELWHDRGLPPALTLKPRHRADGEAALARIGIGPGDWFVGLHVREEGWAGEAASGHNKFRSAACADYLAMIDAVTRLGGWVVRLGDRSMTPLPPWPRVFDYARSDLKSDWMDLFLCAAARFVVGTSSGAHYVATLFGTPVVLTNHQPMVAYPIGPNDMVIHKTLYARRERRLLTIQEAARPPMNDHSYTYFFEDQDIDVIPNTSEEITDVCLQMIDHLDGRAIYQDRDLALWQTYRDRTAFRGHRFRYPIGRQFLRNVEPLLGPPET